jgi:hypothetical protein
MLNRSTVNLTIVALLTLLFAGCAVESPRTENLSATTAATYLRTVGPAKGNTDDLQPNPSDSPEFYNWGSEKDLLPY